MKKATFAVDNASSHSSLHNSRKDRPSYLIEPDKNFKANYYELIYSDEEFTKLAKEKYKNTKNQPMQKKQIKALIKEVAPSLEEHHTIDDVKTLFKKLNKKYGGHYPLEMSIHEDEGHFEDEFGITYYPATDIIYKEEEKSWYRIPLERSLEIKVDKPPLNEFNEKIDITSLKKIKNRHAHIKFSMFDLDAGKTGRMTRGEVGQRLKFVANELGMGYEPETKTKGRKPVYQIKKEHKKVRNERVKAFLSGITINVQKKSPNLSNDEPVNQKKMNQEIKKLKKQLIDSNNAKPKDYQELKNLEKLLKEKIKNKELSISELKFEMTKFFENFNILKKENTQLQEVISLKEQENESLIRINETLSLKLDKLGEKNPLDKIRTDHTDYKNKTLSLEIDKSNLNYSSTENTKDKQ